MGCCTSSFSLPADAPEEERLFLQREYELGYSAHSSIEVVGVISANRAEDKVSISQFNEIAKNLALNCKDLDTLGTPINALYYKMMERGKYDAVKLSVMGALLGKGQHKGPQFLASISVKGAQVVTLAEIQSLFDAMLFISCEALPVLASCSINEEPAPGQAYDRSFIQEFAASLRPGCPKLCERLTNSLLRGRKELPVREFLAAFEANETLLGLVSPYAVRKAVRMEMSGLRKTASRSLSSGFKK